MEIEKGCLAWFCKEIEKEKCGKKKEFATSSQYLPYPMKIELNQTNAFLCRNAFQSTEKKTFKGKIGLKKILN